MAKQRWFQKATVQAAIVRGICVIIAAAITVLVIQRVRVLITEKPPVEDPQHKDPAPGKTTPETTQISDSRNLIRKEKEQRSLSDTPQPIPKREIQEDAQEGELIVRVHCLRDDSPVKDCTVTIVLVKDRSIRYQGITDANGKVQFRSPSITQDEEFEIVMQRNVRQKPMSHWVDNKQLEAKFRFHYCGD